MCGETSVVVVEQVEERLSIENRTTWAHTPIGSTELVGG